jgi:predicted Zn-dependent protease with MMP-like domain
VRAAIDRLFELVGDEDPRPHLLVAELAWEREGPEAALAHLTRAVEVDRDDADARYRLALAYEELGDHERMRRELLQVRALDAEADRSIGLGSEEELTFIVDVAAEVIAALPDDLAARLAHVPVVLEPRPSLVLVSEGFDPRAFGLFEGPGQLDGQHAVEAPTRIVLYTANLLAEFADPDELAEQIEITVLHEIGHYFGFEEEDMERLGLE